MSNAAEYIAGKMYLHYCRKNSMKPKLTDEQILRLFEENSPELFATPGSRKAWIERAGVAIKAYEEYFG